jgi:hypothetical protein
LISNGTFVSSLDDFEDFSSSGDYYTHVPHGATSSLFDDGNGSLLYGNETGYGVTSGGGDEEDHAAHQELVDAFTFYVYCIPLPMIAIFGILGNTVSIIILSRPQMRSSINCCLLALASFDLILIVTSLLMFTFPTIYRETG